MMIHIQDWVHRLEERGGLRFLRPALVLLTLAGLIVSYNFRGFKNMATQEAMDSAQLARNIAENRGFSTLVVRPFSLYLVQRAAEETLGPPPPGDTSDRSRIRGNHPDLANAPLYPLLLAGIMKIAPPVAYYPTHNGKSIWNKSGSFWVYPPDFVISMLNQFLFLLSILMVFFLAKSIFDSGVAWTSAIVFLCTDLMWRFSISGLSTMLLIVITLALFHALVRLEKAQREGASSLRKLVGLAAIVGLMLGLGGLTRYSFLCTLVPIFVFVSLFLVQQRIVLCLTIFTVTAAVMSPWIYRNYQLSHTPFGVAGYAAWENTPGFEEFRLQRTLKPDPKLMRYDQLWYKAVKNVSGTLQDELPRMGGNWIIVFFAVGLMVGYKEQRLGRLRWFVAFCIPAYIFVQSLCRTQLSENSPMVNGENLLIVLQPLVVIFGVSSFFVLLDQFPFPHPGIRTISIGALCLTTSLPMILTFFSPRTVAVAYPPYYPPTIQLIGTWMKPEELIMSDVPWAVAWYGKRQSIWYTLNAREDFFAVYDFLKPIHALYLTPETLDSRFLSQWVRASEHSWGSFILETVNRQEIPGYFPLRKAPSQFLPEQFFISDTIRWNSK